MVPTISQFVGLFNIFVGLLLTLSVLLLGAGAILWVVRLGTWPTYRDDAIALMEWAVGILFTLVLLLLVAQFVQQKTAVAVYILGFIIIGLVIYGLIKVNQAGDDEKNEPGRRR